MPRGAEYAEGTPASDNAIEAGENKIAGAPKEGNVSFLDAVPDLKSWLLTVSRTQYQTRSIAPVKQLLCHQESRR